MRIKKGDKVIFIAGHEKGKEGVVKQAFPAENKITVDGLNLVTKHNKPSQQNTEDTITKIEAKVDVSNVMLIDPKKKVPTRVGYRFEEVNGKMKKVRFAKKSGAKLD